MPRLTRRLTTLLAAMVALVGLAAVPQAAGAAPEPPGPPTVYMPAYLDTATSSVFAGAIRSFSAAGITRGCDAAGRFFCPGDSVTRGQMAAFLVRAIDFDTERKAPVFVDTAGSVFRTVIGELAAAGVTKGCNPPANDRFCPNRPVTRGEMAAFLVRALHLDDPLGAGYRGRFIDDDGSVFEADIARLARAGITYGCNPPTNDRFCPGQAVSRQQMAAFLVRALELPAVPLHPGSVTVERVVSAGPASTLTVCHGGSAKATRVRNAGWGGVFPKVPTNRIPPVLRWSSGSYNAVTDVWTTDPSEGCATFESDWDPDDVPPVVPGIPPGYPDAKSTGPTNESLIPAKASGRVTTTHDGQVLKNFHAENVVIRHDNVTLKNFRVTRADPEAWFAIAQLDHLTDGGQVKGTVIQDGQIITRKANGAPQPAGGHAINGAFMTVRRMDISYMGNGIVGREFLAEDNYIHHLIRYEDEHNDGIVSLQGSNMTIRHNTILLPDQQTGTVSMFTDHGPIDDVLIEDNYLNGGSYTVYAPDKAHGVPTNLRIVGNKFGRDYLFGILKSPGPLDWTGNVWADTGKPVKP